MVARLETPQSAPPSPRSDCPPQTVHEQLWAFVSPGVVVEYRLDPPVYARNDAYFGDADG